MSDITRLNTRPEEPNKFFFPDKRSVYLDKDITEGKFVDNGFPIEFELEFRFQFTTNYTTTGITNERDFKNYIEDPFNSIRNKRDGDIRSCSVGFISQRNTDRDRYYEVECKVASSEDIFFCPFESKKFKNLSSFIEKLKSTRKMNGYRKIMMHRINDNNWIKSIQNFNWEFKKFELILSCDHKEICTFNPTYHIEYFYIKDGKKYLDYRPVNFDKDAVLFSVKSAAEADEIIKIFDSFQAKVST